MGSEIKSEGTGKTNGAIDIAKLVMAVLVIGIHTEPFGFNIWLDRGFGIITRLCVPFFFVASAYFYWLKEKPLKDFLKRILILYLIWSVLYLPFDIAELSQMPVLNVVRRFLWDGNEHALWYLWGSAVGFVITWLLLKILKPRYILIISVLFLIIGTVKSTYSTAVFQLFGFRTTDFLGSRNGLFYGFAYVSLGMAVAKSASRGITADRKKLIAGFAASLILLAAESYLFIVRFGADSTILWLSVFPYTYFFFRIVLNVPVRINKQLSLFFRKMSTLMFVSQFLFIPLLSRYLSNMPLFAVSVLITAAFSASIIKLSETKALSFLRYLY